MSTDETKNVTIAHIDDSNHDHYIARIAGTGGNSDPVGQSASLHGPAIHVMGQDDHHAVDEEYAAPRPGEYRLILGRMPFKEPNVRPGKEEEDLLKHLNQGGSDTCLCVCCMFTGIGCCYVCCCKTLLVGEGEYGFSLNGGRPEILLPGWHFLASPVNIFVRKVSVGENNIVVGPVSIIRIPQGQIGFAMNNSKAEILLPGLHVRKNGAFKFSNSVAVDQELIEYGPLKILTVTSGCVRLCYNAGRVQIYPEGRYAINSGSFKVGGIINTQQQNIRFNQHRVLLDGGISLIVEGLLTYQVIDVEKLIKMLGEREVKRAIEDVTEAEIARVFASIHLEQLASVSQSLLELESKQESLLGKEKSQSGDKEGESRNIICSKVIDYIKPIVEPWGVRVLNFQLLSTKLANDQYAREYEEASLAISKAKAGLRSADAENEIMISKSKAKAQSVRIEAEGAAEALLIRAESEAKARKIDASARNEAAESMRNEFAKQYAMSGQDVEFARALKATSLTVLPDSSVGRTIVAHVNNPGQN